MNTISKCRLEELTSKLVNHEIPAEETAQWLAVLEKHVPHPKVAGCILWSDDDFGAD